MESEIDINLLKTMVLLCQLRSIRLVGLKLGISESAVSKQLAKLQQQLGRALFERTPKGLEPTSYTLAILPSIEQALGQIRSSLSISQFEPENYHGCICIALPTTLLDFYGSRLFKQLKAIFPNAQIRLNAWNTQTVAAIQSGTVTLGVHGLNSELQSNIYQKFMWEDEVVVAISDKYSEQYWHEISDWPFIKFLSSGWNDHRFHYLEHLQKLNIALNCLLEVDSVSVAWELLQQDKYAFFVTRQGIRPHCKLIQVPKEMEYQVKMYSSRRLIDRTSPLHNLLHSLVTNIITNKIE